jgi:hypothetical protein
LSIADDYRVIILASGGAGMESDDRAIDRVQLEDGVTEPIFVSMQEPERAAVAELWADVEDAAGE